MMTEEDRFAARVEAVMERQTNIVAAGYGGDDDSGVDWEASRQSSLGARSRLAVHFVKPPAKCALGLLIIALLLAVAAAMIFASGAFSNNSNTALTSRYAGTVSGAPGRSEGSWGAVSG